MSLADNIRRLREQRQFSQAELAQKVGVWISPLRVR